VSVARADITGHTGTNDPLGVGPGVPAGTGTVDVLFGGEDDLSFLSQDYQAGITPFNMTHQINYDFDSGQPPVFVQTQEIVNTSTLPWAGFSITLELADFYQDDEGAKGSQVEAGELTVSNLGFDPDGFTPTDLSMTLTRDLATSSVELRILFGASDMEFGDFFDLRYWIDRLPPTGTGGGFTMFASPILAPEFIPAPGAAVLAMLGFGCAGWIRRRVR